MHVQFTNFPSPSTKRINTVTQKTKAKLPSCSRGQPGVEGARIPLQPHSLELPIRATIPLEPLG